jgi:hypothetical protein
MTASAISTTLGARLFAGASRTESARVASPHDVADAKSGHEPPREIPPIEELKAGHVKTLPTASSPLSSAEGIGLTHWKETTESRVWI